MQGYKAMAGIEYEFCKNSLYKRFLNELDHFSETADTLASKRGHNLTVTLVALAAGL
jgi:hypothetical protein